MFRRIMAFVKGQTILSNILENKHFMSEDEMQYNSNYKSYKLRLKQDLDLNRMIHLLQKIENQDTIETDQIAVGNL